MMKKGNILTPSDIAELIDLAQKEGEKLIFVPFGEIDENLVLLPFTRELYAFEQDEENPVVYITYHQCFNNFYQSDPHPNDKRHNSRHIKGGSKGPHLGHIGKPCRLLSVDF